MGEGGIILIKRVGNGEGQPNGQRSFQEGSGAERGHVLAA